jgi:secreted trypsin-like serine protease
MLVAVIISVFVAFANCQSCGRRPLKPNEEEFDYDKVVGGVQSLRGDWPWSCSMRYQGSHICGGSLIAEGWIVTAAHCVSYPNNPERYRWMCGIHQRSKNESYTVEFTTIKIYKHESYDNRKIQHDIALYQVRTVHTQHPDYVSPACTPRKTDTHADKTSVAMGWGTTSSGGSIPDNHMEVVMPVLLDDQCYAAFKPNLDVKTQVCAGRKGEGKDTCQGDSGGPLVVKNSNGFWDLIGLTSWGYGCGDGGVYTRVAAYVDWITSKGCPVQHTS